MERCLTWYRPRKPIRVADLGAANANGSYRQCFQVDDEYIGFDLADGAGVDIVLSDPYQLPLDDNSTDVVISGQMLEHCAHFWRVFEEIARVLKPRGLAFIIAPSAGPVHRYPVDCYRFYPDAYEALADWSGLRLVDSWQDERGPWRDLVGIFQKDGDLVRLTAPPVPEPATFDFAQHHDPRVESQKGQEHYLDALVTIHDQLKPRFYLEVGVRNGASLGLCRCKGIGIDPCPDLSRELNNIQLYKCKSDDFFFFYPGNIPKGIDLALIDGMHLAEYVYRDFMNLESFMSPGGAIVIDDVLPNHPGQASRARQSQIWCGDVWRFVQLLAEVRPDLKLTWLDVSPTGLLVVSGLKPKKRLLVDRYNPLMRRLEDGRADAVPQSLLKREMAVAPNEANIRAALGLA